MPPPNNVPSRERWRLRNGLLWILSAGVGAITVLTAASIIHDTSQRRIALRMVAHSAAQQIATHITGRLEVLGLETFAPVVPGASARSLTGRTALDALARAQRAAAQCRCRGLLPVTEFFSSDNTSDALDRISVTGDVKPTLAPASALADLARRELDRARAKPGSLIHLIAGPTLGGNAVVTFVQHDDSGAVVAVYGLVAGARETLRTLFVHEPAHWSAVDSNAVLVRLDTLSIEVRTADSIPVFGALDPDRRFRGTARPPGPLDGLAITVALSPGQVPSAVLAHTSSRQLWHLGLLLAATVLVLGVTAASSRREVVLARARSDFIAGVQHDLRMPLAQILLAGETLTLRRDRDESERLGLVSSIVRETRRLITLVENVLLFSRGGVVGMRPSLRPVPVAQLQGDVVEAVRLAVEDASQSIEVPAESSLTVLGDRHLLRQALVNLVDNALKYGSPGQRIRLGAEQHSAALVHLFVEDEGPGVPPAERERVFEPYERLSRDQDSERTGTGLGLAVVRQIVLACNGRVWIEDAPAGGSRVVIELPSSQPRPEPT
ncbi:MAG: HAMP domain-containing sensor histidine kinase [Gemmatimonadota bacterium]